MRRTRESVERVWRFLRQGGAAARLAPAGIDVGDAGVRYAAQDDLFAALLYQHPLAC